MSTNLHPFLHGGLALSPLRPAFWLEGKLDIANRTIRRWLGAEEMPPDEVAEQMIDLLKLRAAECAQSAADLELLIGHGTLRKTVRHP